MSQTALERRDFPVPTAGPRGNDPSRPGLRGRRAVPLLIRFKRLLRCLLCASNLASGLIRRAASCRCLHPPSSPAPPSNPHSARSTAGAQLPATFVPWRFLGRRPPQPVEGVVMPASKNLHNSATSITQRGW